MLAQRRDHVAVIVEEDLALILEADDGVRVRVRVEAVAEAAEGEVLVTPLEARAEGHLVEALLAREAAGGLVVGAAVDPVIQRRDRHAEQIIRPLSREDLRRHPVAGRLPTVMIPPPHEAAVPVEPARERQRGHEVVAAEAGGVTEARDAAGVVGDQHVIGRHLPKTLSGRLDVAHIRPVQRPVEVPGQRDVPVAGAVLVDLPVRHVRLPVDIHLLQDPVADLEVGVVAGEVESRVDGADGVPVVPVRDHCRVDIGFRVAKAVSEAVEEVRQLQPVLIAEGRAFLDPVELVEDVAARAHIVRRSLSGMKLIELAHCHKEQLGVLRQAAAEVVVRVGCGHPGHGARGGLGGHLRLRGRQGCGIERGLGLLRGDLDDRRQAAVGVLRQDCIEVLDRPCHPVGAG